MHRSKLLAKKRLWGALVGLVIGAAPAWAQAQPPAPAPAVDVINHLRVGGVQQVQLDVTVARVARQEFRALNFDFLTNSKNFFLSSTVGGAAITPGSIGAGGALHPGGGLTGDVGAPNGF